MNAKRMLADRLERLVWDKKQAIEVERDARAAGRQAEAIAALPTSMRSLMARRDALAKELSEVDKLIGVNSDRQIISRGDGQWYDYRVKLTVEDVAEFDARRKAVEAMLEEIPFVLLGSKADDLRAAIAGFEAKLSAIVNPPQPASAKMTRKGRVTVTHTQAPGLCCGKPGCMGANCAPAKGRRRSHRVTNNGGL